VLIKFKRLSIFQDSRGFKVFLPQKEGNKVSSSLHDGIQVRAIKIHSFEKHIIKFLEDM